MKLPIWSEPGSRAKWERCLHQNAARWNTRSQRSVKDKLPQSPDTHGTQSKKPGMVRPLQALVSTMMKRNVNPRFEEGPCCIVTKYFVSFRIESSEMDHAAFGALRDSLFIVFSLSDNGNNAGAGSAFMHEDTATTEGSSVQTIRYQSRRQGWRSRDRYHAGSGVSDPAVRLSA